MESASLEKTIPRDGQGSSGPPTPPDEQASPGSANPREGKGSTEPASPPDEQGSPDSANPREGQGSSEPAGQPDGAATGSRHGSPKVGSLEHPERIENVPGHVIPILQQEFDDFDTESTRFLSGELDGEEFTKFRLKQGVYGQRQPDVQMVRVKLPLGGVNPDQLDAFAAGIEKYVPLRKGHITTRQNVQMHHVPLPDAAKLIRELGDAGLSSREGCGNTMRNVTGDPRAGTLAGELFDITPYAGAYVRYFVRHPTTQNMPRKFKTAFAATDGDNAITRIHDLAFVPRERDGVRGVEVRVGGGTSIMPRIAPTLYEFVELDNGDYLKVAEAIVRIFDRTEWLRPNRARARIKVLVDKIGIDAFRDLVEEELTGDWVGERNFSLEPIVFDHDEQVNAPDLRDGYATPNGDLREFDRFLESNVQRQRQSGFSTVEVVVPRGDLTPDQLRGLAQIMREYTGGFARTSVHQNLILRWVRDGSVYEVWSRLSELSLSDAGADEVTDVVSCPGTDSCKLGITSSMGLNQAIHERLAQMQIEDELTRRIHIKMSGCPNGCGQHHIANIGFYGASIKVGEHAIPAYIPHLGGAYEGGDVRYGERVKSRLPAKRVPEAIERWIRFYQSERSAGEEFNAFVDRVGAREFETRVKDLAMPIEFSLENMNYFIDWSKSKPFEVIRGEGECAV